MTVQYLETATVSRHAPFQHLIVYSMGGGGGGGGGEEVLNSPVQGGYS